MNKKDLLSKYACVMLMLLGTSCQSALNLNGFDWNLAVDGSATVTLADGAVATQPITVVRHGDSIPADLEAGGASIKQVLVDALVAGAESVSVTGIKVIVNSLTYDYTRQTAGQ